MYKEIFKAIKAYNNIVIARHVGVDPDAMSSQIALKNSIKLTFPEKNVSFYFSKKDMEFTKEMFEQLKLNENEKEILEKQNALYLDIFNI